MRKINKKIDLNNLIKQKNLNSIMIQIMMIKMNLLFNIVIKKNCIQKLKLDKKLKITKKNQNLPKNNKKWNFMII